MAGSTKKMWTPGVGQPAAPPPKAKQKTQKSKLVKPEMSKRRRWLKILKWVAIVGFGGFLLMIATVAFVFWMYGRDPSLPDYQKLSDYQPKLVTLVLDANGRRIGEVFGDSKVVERRSFVPYNKIPDSVVNAFVAAEDTRFWDHEGIDYTGMFRAFLKNLRTRKASEGASTITQQVVKNLLLTPEKTFKRKIQEIILARRLEKALTKEEIITLYLNEIYFGAGRFGVQEASRFYFGVDIEKVNLGQAALLAGMPKEPERIAPHKKDNWARAKERQQYVLKRLFENGIIKQADKDKWWDGKIEDLISKDPFPMLNSAPEWVDLARRELVALKGEQAIDKLGAEVRTTLDPKLQADAQAALQRGLRAVDARRKAGRAIKHYKTDKLIDEALARLAREQGNGKPDERRVLEAVVLGVHDDDNELEVDLGNYKAAIALGTDDDARFRVDKDGKPTEQKPSERFKRGDLVEVTLAPGKGKHAAHKASFARPEGAVVIIDVKTRKVKALVGGYDLKVGDFNRATRAMRQPGSSFKPFVYAAGIDAGKFSAGSKINDAPEVFDLWRPKNYDSKFAGPVLMRQALAKSINTIAIKVTHEVTPAAVANLAKRMGIESTLGEHMSISLGSVEVTPLEMTNAIATFAAGGIAAKPRFVDAIDGKSTPPAKGEQVLRPEVAFIVTDMMRSVVTSGTASAAQKLGIPVAGKTGTSNDASDTWFVGMTPDYAIGVWVGYDKRHPMGREAGGTTAVPIFVDVAKSMDLPAKPFPRPSGIVEAKIDRATGELAPDGAPKDTIATELYLPGTVPTTFAAKPGEVTEQNQVTSEYEDEN